MKVDVNKELCIGCGICVNICEDVFQMDDEGLAFVKDDREETKEENISSVKEAIESCPTNAIIQI